MAEKSRVPEKFPSTVYVTSETHGGDDFLVVREDVNTSEFDRTTEVAVYCLVEVGTVEVTRKYVAPVLAVSAGT